MLWPGLHERPHRGPGRAAGRALGRFVKGEAVLPRVHAWPCVCVHVCARVCVRVVASCASCASCVHVSPHPSPLTSTFSPCPSPHFPPAPRTPRTHAPAPAPAPHASRHAHSGERRGRAGASGQECVTVVRGLYSRAVLANALGNDHSSGVWQLACSCTAPRTHTHTHTHMHTRTHTNTHACSGMYVQMLARFRRYPFQMPPRLCCLPASASLYVQWPVQHCCSCALPCSTAARVRLQHAPPGQPRASSLPSACGHGVRARVCACGRVYVGALLLACVPAIVLTVC